MTKKDDTQNGKAAAKPRKEKNSGKNQGHEFRCLPRTVAQIFIYLKDHPDKIALVDAMGFGALSHLPDKNLDQRLLKKIYNRYDIHDNTIYSDATAVSITTEKIGDALGLCSTVIRKELSQEDRDVHKFFQGKTATALQELIKTTPVDSDENRKLFMRSFMLYIQKVFLLPDSTASITPTVLTTIFDLENTRNRNWALHVHNFLLLELKKAKQNNSVGIYGCCYALLIIYFHETHFGERSKEPAAQPPWLAFWTSDALKKRLKQENKNEAGLLKTGQMIAKKEVDTKKSTKRVPLSDSESDASSSTEGDGDSKSSSSNSEATKSKEQPQQERRIKMKNDRAVVGSNAPMNITQQSVAHDGISQSEDATLAEAMENIRKRKREQIKGRRTKQRTSTKSNEDGPIIPSQTRMFDSFDTVSLGRDDSDNIVVEGSTNMPSQPSQPAHVIREVLETEAKETTGGEVHHDSTKVQHPGADVHHAEDDVQWVEDGAQHVEADVQNPEADVNADVQHAESDVQHHSTELQHGEAEVLHVEPLIVIMPIQPETQGHTEVKDIVIGEPDRDQLDPIKLQPVPVNVEMPSETQDPEHCSLTLRSWLQPEIDATPAKAPLDFPDEVITQVLLSMNQQDDNPGEQLEEQFKSPTQPLDLVKNQPLKLLKTIWKKGVQYGHRSTTITNTKQYSS